MNPNLIICVFCGKQADIVKYDDATLVKCGHCEKETELNTYKEMFNQWIDSKRKQIHER
jgi:transcription elongation factor Elf1